MKVNGSALGTSVRKRSHIIDSAVHRNSTRKKRKKKYRKVVVSKLKLPFVLENHNISLSHMGLKGVIHRHRSSKHSHRFNKFNSRKIAKSKGMRRNHSEATNEQTSIHINRQKIIPQIIDETGHGKKTSGTAFDYEADVDRRYPYPTRLWGTNVPTNLSNPTRKPTDKSKTLPSTLIAKLYLPDEVTSSDRINAPSWGVTTGRDQFPNDDYSFTNNDSPYDIDHPFLVYSPPTPYLKVSPNNRKFKQHFTKNPTPDVGQTFPNLLSNSTTDHGNTTDGLVFKFGAEWVRVEEVALVVMVLLLWIAAITMFFNRWVVGVLYLTK